MYVHVHVGRAPGGPLHQPPRPLRGSHGRRLRRVLGEPAMRIAILPNLKILIIIIIIMRTLIMMIMIIIIIIIIIVIVLTIVLLFGDFRCPALPNSLLVCWYTILQCIIVIYIYIYIYMFVKSYQSGLSHKMGRLAREILLFFPLPSPNSSRMSYHTRHGAAGFRGNKKGVYD